MRIKQFRESKFRVPDPQHPGRSVMTRKWLPTGAESHTADGVTYLADDDGWFDIPDHIAAALPSAAPNGAWFSQGKVDEEVVAGLIDEADAIIRPPVRAYREPVKAPARKAPAKAVAPVRQGKGAGANSK